MSDNCLFCKILAGDVPSTEVYSDEEFYAFRDINPGAPTHVLVIPREHIDMVQNARDDHDGLMGRLLLAGNKVARQEGLDETGYRFVINNGVHGGQTVYHIHLHVFGGRPLSWPPG